MKPFGITKDGYGVERLTLQAGPVTAKILTLGGILQDVRLEGVPHSLTLGSEDLAAYDGGPLAYFGAIAGPVANRLSGGRAEVAGREIELEPFAAGGHSLHSEPHGLHARIWSIEDFGANHVELVTWVGDGEDGLPGNRTFRALWSGSEDGTLTLTVTVETDAPTLMNIAQHSMWNLAGTDTIDGHLLSIAADRVLHIDSAVLPTGAALDVYGWHYDFREPKELGPDDRFDHNWCLSEAREPMREVATLEAPDGPKLTISTTEPGLQVYTADGYEAEGVTGLDGRSYGNRCGIALEPQFWPDAPNHDWFPSIRLDPGEPWTHVTQLSFTR
ncbi:aldose epimerase family protein [Tropicimonas sp. IMCC34011]|uniref:aldose epimerase family protein n=1 Tax=Tropicimonas sp. IMCC34011 TaxID=2248759 RepID=UPI000E22F3C2|nr:aldose epimerase family protein [Tropicimonas sp. IMCC34011]